MPINALTRQVGLKVGPVVVETLLKRYFDRVKAQDVTQLRQDELLYDAAFNIIKVVPYLILDKYSSNQSQRRSWSNVPCERHSSLSLNCTDFPQPHRRGSARLLKYAHTFPSLGSCC